MTMLSEPRPLKPAGKERLTTVCYWCSVGLFAVVALAMLGFLLKPLL